MRIGAMLESKRKPLRASTSSAQSDRSLIDHSGARNPLDVGDAAGGKRREAPIEIRRERRRRQRIHASVHVAVRSDLVPGLRDALDELRMTLGDVTEHEERGSDAGAVQQIQQPIGRHDHAAGQRRPVVGRERAVDAADVKPLLDIDREDVGDAPTSCRLARPRAAPDCRMRLR